MKASDLNRRLPEQEAIAVIEACPKLRDKLILRTIWETGCKISWVLSIIRDNIDPLNNCLYVLIPRQRGIRKKVNESMLEYRERKRKFEQREIERKVLLEQRKGPLLATDHPPLKPVFLNKDSTLCRDLLNYANENGIGPHNWLFHSDRSRDGRLSVNYVRHVLASAKDKAASGCYSVG